MIYCINPEADEPILLINKHIGFDDAEGQGVDGAIFQSELLQLDEMGKKRIQVWINSPGGIVMDGYNIYNAILKTKTKVDTYCVGIAASIAAVIFQAGRKRIMADYGLLMYHNPYGGDSVELKKMRESIAVMIAERTGKNTDDVLKIMDRTTWMNATEALTVGFCDEIEASENMNAKHGNAKAMWDAGKVLANSFLLTKNTLTMTKVTNKLGLTDSANEDAIVAAINAIENKKAEADDKLKKMEDSIKAMENEMEDMKAKYAEAKKKAEDADSEKEKAKNEAEDAKAKNLLNTFVTQGRIKADAVDSWKETYKALGEEKTKNLLEALPLTKVANKIDVNGGGEAVLTNVAASKMNEVRNKFNL